MLLTLLTITGQELFRHVLIIIAIAVIFWIVWWLIQWIGVPEPFLKVLKVILGCAAAFLMINEVWFLATGHYLIQM